eukprot:TRINITY_DN9604_c0_g4_i1.p2 TRINITY_DN9604_c0_g4~~TRINITY_DN9604_c0_g4_i1.p2  ORF type:complete len:394 (+),score=87.56 TRINITY_DN9604_c0_g4_i1:87-1184(+)
MAEACEVQLDDQMKEAVAGRIRAAQVPGQTHTRHLECSICKNPAFDTPVRAYPCGHMYHQECLERWLRTQSREAPSCPDCRQMLPPGRNAFTPVDRVVKAVLDEVDVECPQDCEAPAAKRMRFHELGDHIRKRCPETKLLCSGEGCAVVLPRHQMTTEHLPQCEHVLVTCAQCQTGVKRGRLQEHEAASCSHRRVTCEYCKQGSIIHHEKEDHEMSCTGPVAVRDIVMLRRQMAEMQEVLAAQRAEIVELRRARERDLPAHLYLNAPPLAATGQYVLLQERHNGAPMWGRDGRRIFKTNAGHWGVHKESDGPRLNKGYLRITSIPGTPAPVSDRGWEYLPDQSYDVDREHGWVPMQISVTVVDGQ